MKAISKLWAGMLAVMLLFAAGAIVRLSTDNRELGANLADRNLALELENVYEKSFYEMADHVNSLEVGLAKVRAAATAEMTHFVLTELQVDSEAALSDLSSLPFEPGSGEKLKAYINQVRDFSAHLQRSLFKEGTLSEDDYRMLAELEKVGREVAGKIAELSGRLGREMLFIKNGSFDINITADFNRMVTDFNERVLKYPEMIYDGPFADVKERSVTLDLPLLTAEQAAEKLKDQLSAIGVTALRPVSEFNNKIPVYVFEAERENGGGLFIEVTQNGGIIVLISRHFIPEDAAGRRRPGKNENADSLKAPEGIQMSAGEAQETARVFANSLGFDVEPIWVSKMHGEVIYVNLAPVIDDVIIYPDIVKVAIDGNGICGFESFNYLANHKERVIEKPALSAAEAKSLLNTNMSVTNYNLALVPKRHKEILCWEFECRLDDSQFYVFIDANLKNEVDIFKVIEGTEGYNVV